MQPLDTAVSERAIARAETPDPAAKPKTHSR